MKARSLRLGIALAATAFFSASAQARDFTIVAWGGKLQDVYRETYFKPFTEMSGSKVLEDVYLGGWGQFEAMQKTGVGNWDVVQVESSELARGCEEGTFVKLDWSRIADKNEFIPGAVSDCGLGAVFGGILPAYNADLVKTAPTKLTDFWDLKTWPGKRGMRKGPKFNLELAMLADGVAPGEVYSTLETPEGLDRAFKKLDEIKPQIQWWEAGDQPPSWLASGDVAMSIAYSSRVVSAQSEGKNIQMVWERFVYFIDSWVIMAGTPHEDTAYKFLSFFAKPEPQIEFVKRFAYGVPSIAAAKATPEDIAKNLPIGDKMKQAVFSGDPAATQFWLDNLDAITERWNAWAGSN